MSKAITQLRHDPAAGHPLIDGPSGLTPEWLTVVLQASGRVCDARVTAATTTPVGNGMLGTNLRIALRYDRAEAGAPTTLVAKMAAAGETSRASGAALGLYERETRFYQVIAPRIGRAVPSTLFADISADGTTFCLLFEDLAPARGGDQLTGCSLADAEAAIDTAAAMHAPLWGDEPTLAQPWMSRQTMVGMYSAQLPPCVEMIKVRFAALLEPGVPAILDAYAAAIRPWFANSLSGRCQTLRALGRIDQGLERLGRQRLAGRSGRTRRCGTRGKLEAQAGDHVSRLKPSVRGLRRRARSPPSPRRLRPCRPRSGRCTSSGSPRATPTPAPASAIRRAA